MKQRRYIFFMMTYNSDIKNNEVKESVSKI